MKRRWDIREKNLSNPGELKGGKFRDWGLLDKVKGDFTGRGAPGAGCDRLRGGPGPPA